MDYTITTQMTFSAAHYLRGHQGSCARLHGHNWTVEVSVTTDKLDENGFVIDFLALEDILKQTLAPFDHNSLNEVAPFDIQNPTAENIAAYIYQAINEKIKDLTSNAKVSEVTVWELGKYKATCRKSTPPPESKIQKGLAKDQVD